MNKKAVLLVAAFLLLSGAFKMGSNISNVKSVRNCLFGTHKMVRRVRYLLVRTFPDMLHYLDDPKIPKSTNALESFFGHLKDNLSIHRGLTVHNRKNFIKWYLHLRNRDVSKKP